MHTIPSFVYYCNPTKDPFMTNQLPHSWQDRLALINEFKMSNADVVATFNTTEKELEIARGLVQKGLIQVPQLTEGLRQQWLMHSNSVDRASVVSPEPSAPKIIKVKTQSTTSAPEKHRGRQTTKIMSAFSKLSTTPVPVELFLKQTGVSKTILRQSKRFLDTPIKVSIKRDKITKQEMICRV